MANARNVGGIGARSGRRRRIIEPHYLTARESALISAAQRRKDEDRGIFRRWNGRTLTATQQERAQAAIARGVFHTREIPKSRNPEISP